MKVSALFYINGYSTPDMVDDLEKFDSLADCKAAFAATVSDAQSWGAGYDDENGPGTAWVFVGHDGGDYPDYVLSIGPRGGVNCSYA